MAIMAPLNGNICGNDRTHPSFPRPGSDWSLARLRRQQTTARTSLRSVRFVCGTAAHGTECAAGELVPLAAAPFIWPAFGAVIAGLPAPESTGHPGRPSSAELAVAHVTAGSPVGRQRSRQRTLPACARLASWRFGSRGRPGRLGVQWLPELGFTDETTILISGRYLEYSLPWGVSVVLGNVPAWPGA
jgi:hypothetical protein